MADNIEVPILVQIIITHPILLCFQLVNNRLISLIGFILIRLIQFILKFSWYSIQVFFLKNSFFIWYVFNSHNMTKEIYSVLKQIIRKQTLNFSFNLILVHFSVICFSPNERVNDPFISFYSICFNFLKFGVICKFEGC